MFKRKPKFPTLATIILVFAILWLLNELKLISIDVPWMPLTIIIIAIGMILNRYN